MAYESRYPEPGVDAWYPSKIREESFQIIYAKAVNDPSAIQTRGTGGFTIRTIDSASITFATSNVDRWQIQPAGALEPSSDLGVSLGSATKRVATGYLNHLVASGDITFTGLPTGGFTIGTTDSASITFATSNADRWQILPEGALEPSSDLGVSLGSATKRVATGYLNHLIASGDITFAGLPTTNPGVTGRLWNNAGAVSVSA